MKERMQIKKVLMIYLLRVTKTKLDSTRFQMLIEISHFELICIFRLVPIIFEGKPFDNRNYHLYLENDNYSYI